MKIFCHLLALAMALSLPAAAQRAENRLEVDPQQLQKLQMAEVAIANLYVDSVDQQQLVEAAIKGMLSKLDLKLILV